MVAGHRMRPGHGKRRYTRFGRVTRGDTGSYGFLYSYPPKGLLPFGPLGGIMSVHDQLRLGGRRSLRGAALAGVTAAMTAAACCLPVSALASPTHINHTS